MATLQRFMYRHLGLPRVSLKMTFCGLCGRLDHNPEDCPWNKGGNYGTA